MNGTPDQAPPYGVISQALSSGRVVPFLGAGASAVYRPQEVEGWEQDMNFLPFGSELARTLARATAFPDDPDEISNLALVASYYEHVQGDRSLLNGALRQAFSGSYRPGAIHALLARVEQPLLIVTTNYDDLIERAFGDRSFHLVVDRGDKNRVWIGKENGLEPIKTSDLRRELMPEGLPIVYKLHGTLDRDRAENDSFLITEQDYVNFLGRAKTCVPPYLAEQMSQASFLFLGYSLTDWNVRVMLSKLRQPTKSGDPPRSWAIHKNPGSAERKIWEAHKVNIYDFDLKLFARELADDLGLELELDPDEFAI